MNDHAAMHYNADLRCYAVINVDKPAGSIGGQVNAFSLLFKVLSMTSGDWLFGIRYENTVHITCVFNANLTSTKT